MKMTRYSEKITDRKGENMRLAVCTITPKSFSSMSIVQMIGSLNQSIRAMSSTTVIYLFSTCMLEVKYRATQTIKITCRIPSHMYSFLSLRIVMGP